MMRIAFSTIACPDFTADQVAAAARQYGYDGVELYALGGQRLTPDVLQTNLAAIRRAFTPGEVPIVCLNSWAQLSSADPSQRAAQADQVARALELASALSCPLVKTFGGELPAGIPTEQVYDYMARSIAHLCERAARLGVRLVLETHDGFCRGATVAELLRRVSHPAFAALWDVHHPYRMGESIAETDTLIGARVAHVHVKDAVIEETGWRFVLLGDGTLPVQDLLSRLMVRGFSGYVSVDWEKMWHPDIPGPDIALPHYASVLRRYLVAA